MVDFIAAFNEGLSAAEIAEKNKREIASVFDELNKQLAEATDGKVKIQIQKFSEHIFPNYLGFNELTRVKEYQAICAINPLASQLPANKIASWDEDRNGYPCKISINNKQHYCEDKSALENSLAVMLQDPIVGKTLSDLMQRSESEEL